jgi:hypothetical protein
MGQAGDERRGLDSGLDATENQKAVPQQGNCLDS